MAGFSVKVAVKKRPDFQKLLGDKLPAAVRGTINDIAFMVRKLAINEIRNSFTLRNKYTERGLVVEKVPAGLRQIDGMAARVGSDYKRGYLALHHEGQVIKGRSPANAARMNSDWAKKVRTTEYISKRGVKDMRSFRSTAKTQRGKIYAMAAIAYRKNYTGLIGVYSENDVLHQGLYRFSAKGRESIGSRGFPRMRMMYKRNRPKKLVAKPWLQRALNRVRQSEVDAIFAKNAARIMAGVK